MVEEIDGVKLTDIVLKSGRIQQDVTGPKTFNGGFKVEGKIQATLLNNVDIPALNLNVVRKDRSAKIEHNLVSINLADAWASNSENFKFWFLLNRSSRWL